MPDILRTGLGVRRLLTLVGCTLSVYTGTWSKDLSPGLYAAVSIYLAPDNGTLFLDSAPGPSWLGPMLHVGWHYSPGRRLLGAVILMAHMVCGYLGAILRFQLPWWFPWRTSWIGTPQ